MVERFATFLAVAYANGSVIGSIRIIGLPQENSVDRFTTVLPFFPFLVVISITPNAALAPYIAAEEASFKTLILSISLGLRLPMSIGTLSTKIRGEPPLMDSNPLMLNSGEVVGSPFLMSILRLGITPCKPSPTLRIGLSSRTSPDTAATAPVRLTFF